MSKKNDIFNATLALIVEEGIKSVTMSKILEKANAGAGTFYNYFSGKDELIHALYKQVMDRVSARILTDFDAASGVRDRFDHLVYGTLEYLLENYDEYSFIDQYSHTLHKLNPNDPLLVTDFSEAFVKTLTDGQLQKIISDTDIHILVYTTIGILTSVVKGSVNNKYSLNQDAKKSVLQICWNAVRS